MSRLGLSMPHSLILRTMAVVGLCVKSSPLQQEASLMRVEECINLWTLWHVQELNDMPFCQSSSNRFSPKANDLSIPKFLALIIVPGIGFNFWSWPEIQWESSWLLLWHLCHFAPAGKTARKVTVVAHRFTAGKTDNSFSSSGSRWSTFQHQWSYSGGIRPPSHYQFNVSTFYDSSVQYL